MPVSTLVDLEGALHHGEVAGEGAEEGEILARQTVSLEGDAAALAAADQLGVSQHTGIILGQIAVLGPALIPAVATV